MGCSLTFPVFLAFRRISKHFQHVQAFPEFSSISVTDGRWIVLPASSPSWLSHRARAWPHSTATKKTICQQSKQKKRGNLDFYQFSPNFWGENEKKTFWH